MIIKDKRILVADQISPAGIDQLQSSAAVTPDFAITAEELVERIVDYDALVVRSRTKVTAEVVAASDRLKVVGRAGVGVDNIDLDACQQKGVIVVNSPNGATISVAELTLGLMISLLRRIPTADRTMKEGEWAKKRLRGEDLYGQTLGLVGLGRIGAAVAERAAALGMSVMAYDPYLSGEAIKSRGAEPATLEKLLAQADVLSIHTPHTEQTHHLIDAVKINQMKSGGYLVCAARGGVIDEDALLAALNSGQVAGAALDVFAQEPPGLTPLVSHPNVIALPHIGAQTSGGQVRAGVDVAEEIIAALRGQPLRWRVV